MKNQFNANLVTIFEEDEVIVIGFVNDEKNERFTFQHALFEGSEQPIYCERNDQIQASYNGIEEIILSRAKFYVKFKDEVVNKMRCKELEISFYLESDRFEKLRDNLIRIFSGDISLSVISN